MLNESQVDVFDRTTQDTFAHSICADWRILQAEVGRLQAENDERRLHDIAALSKEADRILAELGNEKTQMIRDLQAQVSKLTAELTEARKAIVDIIDWGAGESWEWKPETHDAVWDAQANEAKNES